MKLLIDCSNLQAGGGMQVAVSFLEDLAAIDLPNNYFVILSDNISSEINKNVFNKNFIFYDLPKSNKKSILKRKRNVIKIEQYIKPDVGFTVFGPSYHKSNFPKIVGFAIPFIIYSNSPFFSKLKLKEKLKYKFLALIKSYFFKKNSDVLIFETDDANEIFCKKNKTLIKSYTVGNTLNRIFTEPSRWTESFQILKSNFDILCLSANYPHKNLNLIPQVIDEILLIQPGLDFKFHISAEKNEFNFSSYHNQYINYLGKVSLKDLPHLYKHMDVSFIPTLLEIFSTTYLESMFMRVPIVSSDMSFARDICKNAALYSSGLIPKTYAKNLLKVKNDVNLKSNLISNGAINLQRFGSSQERTEKYVDIITKTLKSK